MKTSELKHLAKSKGFRVNDDDEGNLAIVTDSTNVTELLTVWKRFAVISNKHSGVFSIYDSNQLDDELVDAIISYARTPITERKEQYLKVDIPLSDWEKINSGLTFRRDDDNKNYGIMHFVENEGFDAMFDTLRLIQSRYEHEYQQ